MTAFEIESIQRRDAGIDPVKPEKKPEGKTVHALETCISNLRKENKNLKRGRDGKPRPADGKHFEKRKPDLSIPICPNAKCGRRHKGKCLLDRDLDAEQKSLDFACKIKGGMGAKSGADAESRAMARANAVSFEDLDNEENEIYSLVCTPWNPDDTCNEPIYLSYHTCLDVTQKKGACVDTGSPVDITFQQAFAECTTGKEVRLMGIDKSASSIAQEASVGFPTCTDDGIPYLFRTNGQGLYASKASDNVLSHAAILRMGCKVHFKTGCSDDPQYGGYIQLPNGKRITLIFADDVW